jgi:hypothetical protein
MFRFDAPTGPSRTSAEGGSTALAHRSPGRGAPAARAASVVIPIACNRSSSVERTWASMTPAQEPAVPNQVSANRPGHSLNPTPRLARLLPVGKLDAQ